MAPTNQCLGGISLITKYVALVERHTQDASSARSVSNSSAKSPRLHVRISFLLPFETVRRRSSFVGPSVAWQISRRRPIHDMHFWPHSFLAWDSGVDRLFVAPHSTADSLGSTTTPARFPAAKLPIYRHCIELSYAFQVATRVIVILGDKNMPLIFDSRLSTPATVGLRHC